MIPKLRGWHVSTCCLVGERSVVGRSRIARTGGRGGSENAGISSDKEK